MSALRLAAGAALAPPSPALAGSAACGQGVVGRQVPSPAGGAPQPPKPRQPGGPAPQAMSGPQAPGWPPWPLITGALPKRARSSEMRSLAREIASRVPVRRTMHGSPVFVSMSILAPLSRCKRDTVSPPLPMSLPTDDMGTAIVSSSLGGYLRAPPPPPPVSSARAVKRERAFWTCSSVPAMCTVHTSMPFSTEIRAPLCARTSAMAAPREPMMRPVTVAGNSAVSCRAAS
mmetsp:Transcript_80977/g.224977  ORF Transcript_80977/g.224977 Transcript_80977/m.224977 type:complete len:231 (-) Transcript_80977:250-942(-)